MTESKTSTPTGKVHAMLIGVSGKYSGKTFHFINQATIGKNGENTVLLDEGTVSPNHARLFYDSGADTFIIEDLGSRTGILVDGDFVDERTIVAENQVITIANKFSFKLLVNDSDLWVEPGDDSEASEAAYSQPSETVSEGSIGQNAEEKPIESTPVFYLDLIDSISPETRYNLTEGINLIGRDDSNNIVLQDNSVSRHHAVIFIKGRDATVRDLDSKNHTFVDGKKLEKEIKLLAGSQLMIGLMTFNVCDAERVDSD